MFKKIFSKIGLVCMLILFLAIGTLFTSDIGAQVWQRLPGNSLVQGKLGVQGYGQETMRISFGSAATEMRIDAPGSPLVCVDLTGQQQTTAAGGVLTEGFVDLNAVADFLRFTVQLPDTWIDNGDAWDMEFEFDVDRTGAGAGTIDVRIFEYGNVTRIIADTVTAPATRAWTDLNTLATGIGANLDPGDVLLFELTQNGATDNFRIWGVRMKFVPGLERVGNEVDR